MFEKLEKLLLGIPKALGEVFPGFLAFILGMFFVKLLPITLPVMIALLVIVDLIWLQVGILPGIVTLIVFNAIGLLVWFKWIFALALIAFVWPWLQKKPE